MSRHDDIATILSNLELNAQEDTDQPWEQRLAPWEPKLAPAEASPKRMIFEGVPVDVVPNANIDVLKGKILIALDYGTEIAFSLGYVDRCTYVELVQTRHDIETGVAKIIHADISTPRTLDAAEVASLLESEQSEQLESEKVPQPDVAEGGGNSPTVEKLGDNLWLVTFQFNKDIRLVLLTVNADNELVILADTGWESQPIRKIKGNKVVDP